MSDKSEKMNIPKNLTGISLQFSKKNYKENKKSIIEKYTKTKSSCFYKEGDGVVFFIISGKLVEE